MIVQNDPRMLMKANFLPYMDFFSSKVHIIQCYHMFVLQGWGPRTQIAGDLVVICNPSGVTLTGKFELFRAGFHKKYHGP